MNIESIIQAWKAEEESGDEWSSSIPVIPVGEELTEQELEEVVGIGGVCTMCDQWFITISPVSHPGQTQA
ncbi:hypothetical protein EPA93_15590 [Ktedonosporobacter rubrisoli]|uniref:Mersacidin/lichenicidin family type 2 lantibiotic n=1 Tax=Ktedonosporobacter rubrisoli TaxID=2509675 RepID=A0A4P6JPM7_KTERU|nr:hypothetical protein [Ktedonosporobacter rubrisoli]QBD77337.1 hypothetical protein EPA93_15590 [Ktedonosporobacter rubrisoli]